MNLTNISIWGTDWFKPLFQPQKHSLEPRTIDFLLNLMRIQLLFKVILKNIEKIIEKKEKSESQKCIFAHFVGRNLTNEVPLESLDQDELMTSYDVICAIFPPF